MSNYKRQTGNKYTQLKKSFISSCHWITEGGACIGEEVKLCVRSENVANGTTVKVTIKDMSGNVSDIIEGVMQNGLFTSKYTVNEHSVDCLELEAQIADYKLEEKSKPLPILRQIKITMIDEYKNQLDSHKTFHGLPYLIRTDTGHTYEGKINEREIIQNIHYKDEYELELLYQAAKMADTPLATPVNAEDKIKTHLQMQLLLKPIIQVMMTLKTMSLIPLKILLARLKI